MVKKYTCNLDICYKQKWTHSTYIWNIRRGSRSMRGILINIVLDFPFMINQASCWMSSKSVENFLRYGVLNISFGRGLRSIWAILDNIKLDLPFMITKHPAKFNRNRSGTLWVILITHKQKDKQKAKQTHTSKTIPLPNTVWGEVMTFILRDLSAIGIWSAYYFSINKPYLYIKESLNQEIIKTNKKD